MPDDFAIQLDHVSKKYCTSLRRSMLYSLQDITRNMMGRPSLCESLRRDEFWSLQDISLQIKKGEMAGVIGPNGSGKTTLLKLLDGIFWPDTGEVRTEGAISALISAGAGFHPILTGRENIYLNGAILGLSKGEMEKRFDQIVDFSGLNRFLDMPVKYYSTGMSIRLGLAIAMHCEPDILLVDEVLSVGDQVFRNQCIKRISQLNSQGTTVVFVSHNLDLIQMLCQKTYLLNEGRLEFCGETSAALQHYSLLMAQMRECHHPASLSGRCDLTQTFSNDVDVLDIRVINEKGEPAHEITEREDITVVYEILFKRAVNEPRFSASIGAQTTDNIIWHTNLQRNLQFGTVGPGHYELTVTFKSPALVPGIYKVVLGIYESSTGENMVNYRLKYAQFKVAGTVPLRGIVACPSEWRLAKK
jgi:lipopolysaccharide transport system ATP-binding protein